MAKNLGNLLEEEIKGLKTMFKNIDTDKSGTITHEELKRGFTTLGSKVSETEVKQLIEAVSYHYSLLPFRILKISQRMLMNFQANVDGNGTIDINEFISATLDRFKLDHHELFRQEFQHFDKRKRWVSSVIALDKSNHTCYLKNQNQYVYLIKSFHNR